VLSIGAAHSIAVGLGVNQSFEREDRRRSVAFGIGRNRIRADDQITDEVACAE
jgi:hypothetical protein